MVVACGLAACGQFGSLRAFLYAYITPEICHFAVNSGSILSVNASNLCHAFHFVLTLLLLIPLIFYTLPYWSNRPFLIFDIWALWCSGLSARVPECQKLKNGRLDQYGAGPFEQQRFETADVEGVKTLLFSNRSPIPKAGCTR